MSEKNLNGRGNKASKKLNIVIGMLMILIMMNIYWHHTYNQEKTSDINEGYAKEDVEAIEEARDFFLFYFKAEEYGISHIDFWGTNCMSIVDNSKELLRKYSEIKLDEDKKLTYDKKKRKIQIVQEAFVLDTEFNVDIQSRDIYYVYGSEVTTEYGTWVKRDAGIPQYVLYLFGNDMEKIEISDISYTLQMVDKSQVNMIYYQEPYKLNTPYYLFRDTNQTSSNDYQDYYIYVVDQKEWIKFSSIKDIKIEEKYISFIDSDNVFYVYCIEHNSKIYAKALDEDETLKWIYEPVKVYVPFSVVSDASLKENIFERHSECKK